MFGLNPQHLAQYDRLYHYTIHGVTIAGYNWNKIVNFGKILHKILVFFVLLNCVTVLLVYTQWLIKFNRRVCIFPRIVQDTVKINKLGNLL